MQQRKHRLSDIKTNITAPRYTIVSSIEDIIKVQRRFQDLMMKLGVGGEGG